MRNLCGIQGWVSSTKDVDEGQRGSLQTLRRNWGVFSGNVLAEGR